MRRQHGHALLALIAAVALSVSGCSKDDGNKDGGNGTTSEAGVKDGANQDGQPECRRPPLSLCEPPGTRNICPDHWFCPGCNCSGPFKVAACSLFTQDCRWFCTGCYPAEYVGCNDPTADPAILGRCGYCFHNDAGVEVLPDCDRLNAILDAKPPAPPKDASPPAPQDAAATD